MRPTLRISKSKLLDNAKKVVARAGDKGIDITAITKCTTGHIEVAQTFVDGGVKALGDSRLANLKKYQELNHEKWLIRMPMISEAEDAVKYSTISVNSELATVTALNDAAIKLNKKHRILLMIDLGDLREGYIDDNMLFADVEGMLKLKNIEISGIGVNMTCLGTIIPKPETYDRFREIQYKLQQKYDVACEIVSGGNSSSYYMIENNTIPNFITNLRLGEMLLIGREAAYFEEYDYLNHDTFMLETEVIEAKEKPSFPVGEKGRDAFGKEKTFVDIGIRKRIICALGRQDTIPEDLFPLDDKMTLVGASSDHIVMDVSDSDVNYRIGDVVTFRCNYQSALFASTSEYVETIIE